MKVCCVCNHPVYLNVYGTSDTLCEEHLMWFIIINRRTNDFHKTILQLKQEYEQMKNPLQAEQITNGRLTSFILEQHKDDMDSFEHYVEGLVVLFDPLSKAILRKAAL